MKRIFLLKGLDCPNCSAKIEKEVGELDGVQSSVVNLMKQTLTINVAQTAADTIASQIETIVHSHEPDVEVSEIVQESYIPEKKQEANESYNNEDKKLTVRLATGAAIYAIGMALTVFAKVPLPVELVFLIVSYIILGGDVVWQAVRNISKGRVFDEHFLMSVSTIGAFVIGEYPEAVAVMLFYQVGEFFQSLAVERSRKSISDLMDIRPDCATVRRNGELITISPESVAIGEIIIVKPGEKIPLDGVVLDGDSMLDTRALTGESVPRSVHKGDEALSGCMNQTGVLTIKTTKAFGESTASKIIDLVENASSRKAPTENFITTFARYYTPVVVILAAILAILPPILLGGGWTEWIRRGFVFLVVSCPCALVISIPLTFFGGIGAASKRGVLVKGSNYLEALNNVSIIVFDKTGTLTKGVFNVTDILPANGFSKEQVLEYAVQAESFSNHPIAKSILSAYGKEIDQSVISDYKEISGYGISAMAGKKKVYAGNTKLMDSEHVEYTACEKVGTKVYVAVDGQYAGCILITDEVKPDSKKAISDLKHIGVEKSLELAVEKAGIQKEEIVRIVTTGYGRAYIDSGDDSITEITCHAKGAHYLNPRVRTVIDIGGQDIKAISIDENGAVKNFLMNDKCAAGTGRFLEMMARTLGLSLEEMSTKGLEWKENVVISSMCTVFAESEVVSLVAQNKNVADIIHGLNVSVASKVGALAARLGKNNPGEYMMTGGVAKNKGITNALEEKLGAKLYICDEAQLCGALGAALFAYEKCKKGE